MADWSEIFEQRLQTALSTGPEKEETQHRETQKMALFELTPPLTTERDAGRGKQQQKKRGTVCDPTAAFFNSIRRTQASGGADIDGGGVILGNNTRVPFPEHGRRSSFGSAMPRPALTPMMTPSGQVFGSIGQSLSSGYSSTPSPVIEDAGRPIVKKLQESYSKRARDLHGEAMHRLTEVQQALEARLDGLARDENAFLAGLADKQAQFGQLADAWTVKIQVRENDEGHPHQMAVKEKAERVADRVAAMRAAAATLETELAQLWQEWDQAQDELSVVLRAVFGDGKDNADGDGFDAILADAEADMEAVAAEAVQAMRDNEKAFRKLILAEECKLARAMLSGQSKYD